ncbi:MAG: hypothetical protein ABI395_09570 [Sphingobium sp.]
MGFFNNETGQPLAVTVQNGANEDFARNLVRFAYGGVPFCLVVMQAGSSLSRHQCHRRQSKVQPARRSESAQESDLAQDRDRLIGEATMPASHFVVSLANNDIAS